MSQSLSTLPLLTFQSVWQKCVTKAFDFEKIIKTEDAMELEAARSISLKRRLALDNRDAPILEQLQR